MSHERLSFEIAVLRRADALRPAREAPASEGPARERIESELDQLLDGAGWDKTDAPSDASSRDGRPVAGAPRVAVDIDDFSFDFFGDEPPKEGKVECLVEAEIATLPDNMRNLLKLMCRKYRCFTTSQAAAEARAADLGNGIFETMNRELKSLQKSGILVRLGNGRFMAPPETRPLLVA